MFRINLVLPGGRSINRYLLLKMNDAVKKIGLFF
jgi:hypothetical protein